MYRAVLVGKPNVGKSSLFNALCRKKRAIVSAEAGVTRDCLVETLYCPGRDFQLVDLAGLEEELLSERSEAEKGLHKKIQSRARRALETADLLLLVLELRRLSVLDKAIIQLVRKLNKPTLYLLNKAEGNFDEHYLGEATQLGIKEPLLTSAKDTELIKKLRKQLFAALEKLSEHRQTSNTLKKESTKAVVGRSIPLARVAIVGRPNAGKSSLFNALSGENLTLVSLVPGTTRDSVAKTVEWGKENFELFDTAGLRRRSREKTEVEHCAVAKAIHAVNSAALVVLVIDAKEGLAEQDKKIADLAVRRKKSLLLVVNKWDLKRGESFRKYKERLHFLFAPARQLPCLPVSCKTRYQLTALTKQVRELLRKRAFEFNTPQLNQLLQAAFHQHPPQKRGGRAVKLRYATQILKAPPLIRIYVKNKSAVGRKYEHYLRNYLVSEFQLQGTPVTLEFREKV